MRLEHDRFTAVPLIGQQLGISQSLIEKIMAQLKLVALVESKHGPSGGYRLTKPFDEIYVGDLFPILSKKNALFHVMARRLKTEKLVTLTDELPE